MPGKRGLEVASEIKKYETSIGVSTPVPMIMLTGSSHRADLEGSKALGIERYVLKPVIESELIKHLEDLGFFPS